MFCVKCGNKMADGSVFCPQCGTKVGDSGTVTASKQEGVYSKELDKRALKIYLKNVLVLECIVHKLNRQIDELNKKIQDLSKNNYYKKYYTQSGYNNFFHFFYNSKTYYVLTGSDGGNVYNCTFDKYSEKIWVDIETILPKLNKKETWYYKSHLIWSKACKRDIYWIRDYKKRQKDLKREFLQYYKEFQEAAPIEYEKNRQTLSEWRKNYEILCKKSKEANKLLSDAYKINIVPGTMRNNLSAIYYLYDVVSTSSLSFEVAILNFNLEEIKARLDKVIQKQQESIINQARMIAQNDIICAQNEKMLKSIAAVELNTEYAAKYSQIAASNTDSLVWLATHTV